MLWRYTFLILCCVSVVPAAKGLASNNSTCNLVAYTQCSQTDVCAKFSLFENKNDQYVEIDSLTAAPDYKLYFPQNGSTNQRYSISPDGHRVAIAQISQAESLPIDRFVNIEIYDVTTKFKSINTLWDILAGEGNIWSHDSDKYIFIDAYGHYQPSMTDLSGNTLWYLWPPAEPLRNISALSVAWSPDDRHIAVYGEEYPFPVSENAVNDVKTLYVASPLPDNSAEYKPISSPDYESGNFVWLDNEKLAFTQFQYDRKNNDVKNSQLQISSIDGKILYSSEGYYLIYGKLPDNTVLMANLDKPNDTIFLKFDFEALSFQPLTQVPRTQDRGFPGVNFSPNYAYITFIDPETSKLVIRHMDDMTDQLIAPPLAGSIGWWTPDSENLLFLNYKDDIVYTYNISTKLLASKVASEMFLNQPHIPQHPNWLCQN